MIVTSRNRYRYQTIARLSDEPPPIDAQTRERARRLVRQGYGVDRQGRAYRRWPACT